MVMEEDAILDPFWIANQSYQHYLDTNDCKKKKKKNSNFTKKEPKNDMNFTKNARKSETNAHQS